jgi:hypothetical protein
MPIPLGSLPSLLVPYCAAGGLCDRKINEKGGVNFALGSADVDSIVIVVTASTLSNARINTYVPDLFIFSQRV